MVNEELLFYSLLGDMEIKEFADFHNGGAIVHVVGGQVNEDLKTHLDEIANWFVQNDITLLWGDEWTEKFNENHPVALLAKKVVELGGKMPIRILQLGEHYEPSIMERLEEDDGLYPVLDEKGGFAGVYDKTYSEKTGEHLIYTRQQQDRQKLYYNESDALMVLNGGLGAAYEIPNALIYGFSGDMKPYTKIMVIDSDKKFKNFIDAYLAVGGAKIENFDRIEYYDSAKDFADRKTKAGEIKKNTEFGEE